MAGLAFCDYHNMIAILEKYEHNQDSHQIVDFVKASHIRYALTFNPTVHVSYIWQFWSTARIETIEEGTKIFATVDGKLRTVFESSIRRNLKLNDEVGISSLPDAKLFENLQLMGYNILPNQKFTFQKGQFSRQWKYLIHTIMQCLSPKSTGFNEFSSNIATALVCLATNRVYNFLKMIFDGMVKNVTNKGEGSGTPTESHHTPTSEASQSSQHQLPSPLLPPSLVLPPVADEPVSPLGGDSQGEACPTDSSFEVDQDKANIAKTSTLPSDSTPRVTSLAADEGSMQQKLDELTTLCTSLQRQLLEMVSMFEAQELEINNLKARIKVLEDKDRGVVEQSGDDAPIKRRSLDEGEEAAKRVSDDTKEMATVLTSMDAASILTSGGVQVVPTTAEVATATVSIPTASPTIPTVALIFTTAYHCYKVYPLHEKKRSCKDSCRGRTANDHNSLDRSNETVLKYPQEYEQISKDLSIGERIELISDLVKYQENYAQVLKYQTLQRKPRSKKQKKDYYMAEDVERLKRKGLRLEQESAKKLKTSEEVPKEEVLKEKVKEMIQLVPIEEVYVEALQVKHPIIDWKVHTEGQRSYWKIIRPAASDKEMELWVELKRLYEPDVEDQLWTYTQNLMHAPVEWKLYDTCRFHHVTSKDKEIFMLVEKDYPLRKGLAIRMISYKLQGRIVGNKMHKAFPLPVMEFPLSEEVPTTSKESSHCQNKRDATVEKIALLLKPSSNCQSKSYDSYAKLVPHV
nr:hypothetical protein [Tanacetum cinerariifolium]